MFCSSRAHCAPRPYIAGSAKNESKNNQPTEPHLALFYLALLIGCPWLDFWDIVFSPLCCDILLYSSLREKALRSVRILARRALFRAHRRAVFAARLQSLSDFGSVAAHFTVGFDGAASQAFRRGRAIAPQAR